MDCTYTIASLNRRRVCETEAEYQHWSEHAFRFMYASQSSIFAETGCMGSCDHFHYSIQSVGEAREAGSRFSSNYKN